MKPGKLDLIIYQGATFRRKVRLADSSNDPIILTGATVRMHVRTTIDDTTPVIILNAANGRALVTDEANGEVTLYIADEDTELLTFSKGGYDLEVVYANGEVDRVLEGKVTLSREYTRGD